MWSHNPFTHETGLMAALMPETGLLDDIIGGVTELADIWSGGDAKRARAEAAKAKAAETALQAQREDQAFQLQMLQLQSKQAATGPSFLTRQDVLGMPNWLTGLIGLGVVAGVVAALKS